MTEYIKFCVTLSENQKEKLKNAASNKSAITIRLTNNELCGTDELFLTKTQIKRIQKAKSMNKGVDVKISKTQISRVGVSLFSILATKLLPLTTKVLPALATGATSSLSNFGLDKLLGSGGGFLIPQDKIDQLITHKNLLTKNQRGQIVTALQTGGQFVIKQSLKQRGGFLGTLLASIGIPMLIKAITGNGLQNRRVGNGLQNIRVSDNLYGRGMKKKPTGNGLILGKNSPFKNIPLLGDIF